jgi:hypothetical protein
MCKKDYDTEEEARAQQRAEEPLKKESRNTMKIIKTSVMLTTFRMVQLSYFGRT